MRRPSWRVVLSGLVLAVLIVAGNARAEVYPPTYTDQTALPRTGTATYYTPGVMQAVLANRIAWRQVAPCPECVGYVALLRKGDIGRKVWLQYGADVVGPVLVIDCATTWDFLRLKDWWAVDVSWEIAQRWNMQGGLTVTVYTTDPRPTPISPRWPWLYQYRLYWRYLWLFGGEAGAETWPK